MERSRRVRQLKEAVPFAVVGSTTVLDVGGKKVRGRQYPWGVIEVENPSHCDFIKLRCLLGTHMQDLTEVTQDVHYENYRSERLAKGAGAPMTTSSTNIMMANNNMQPNGNALPSSKFIMGRNKLSNEEKTRALTLLKEGASVIRVAAEVNVTRMAIYNLKKAVESLPPGTVPPRKPGSGAPKKTSPRTDKIMRREVLNDPAITAAELKKNHPALLGNVSVRTIQHRLQISLKLPTRRAAKKPLLTEAMKKKWLSFCKR
ncbi:Septin-1 [Chionoecetes opilio]|uniref:Septin-1 n=1 Tax=Chionoecetes opilio TaxID=41210 RepID=A0A8J4XLD9_CHIOP|nr:Septin-1 [Chionoecetes opilio]